MAGKAVVIGSGLAGMSAAAALKSRGVDVAVISKAPGATAFCSGALDLCGDPCAPCGRPGPTNTDVRSNIARLMLREPFHPYTVLAGGEARGAEKIMDLLRGSLSRLFPGNGLLKLAGEPAQNRPCFTAIGSVKFTALFPLQTPTPAAEGMERPAALGLEGLQDFAPAAWARTAKENAAALGRKMEPVAAMIKFGADFDKHSPVVMDEVARDPAGFIRAVKEALAGINNAAAVVLPPVLPAKGRSDLIWHLGEAVAMPVYEPLSLPPSAPGLRLVEHLDRRMEEMGVEMIRARVNGFAAEGHTLKSLLLEGTNGAARITADVFILASGKFLGGGLEKRRAFREKIFGLPVFVGALAPGEVFIEKVLAVPVNGRHALFEAGVRVDRGMRPVDADGTPCFSNLFAAGSVLRGYNYVVDGTGAGAALASGAAAGMNAAEFL